MDIGGKKESMSIERLFNPGKIGKLEIKNRIYMSPMATNFETMDGSITKELIDYYEDRAKGGVGLIITGCTHAELEIARSSITGTNSRLDQHKYIIGLSELTDAVHTYGTKIFAQLTIGHGRFSSPDLYPPGVQPPFVRRRPTPLFANTAAAWRRQVYTCEEWQSMSASPAVHSPACAMRRCALQPVASVIIQSPISFMSTSDVCAAGSHDFVPTRLVVSAYA